MDKKRLDYFCKWFMQKKIFQKAAERLYTSQPTLTYRLQQIEKKNMILNCFIEEEEALNLRNKENY
ncbi:hypothetical protein GCM10020331_086110 [Ectobacillus funiculus]